MNDLERQFRKVLIGLELVSHGATASVGYSTGGKSDEIVLPEGCAGAEHLHWRWAWNAAKTDDGRQAVLRAAKGELERLTGHSAEVKSKQRQSTGETHGELCDRIVKEGEGYTTNEAAVHFRCLERTVRQARKNGERDPDRGYETATSRSRVDEKASARARDLRSQGISERNIAMITGLHKTQVRRALGKAA